MDVRMKCLLCSNMATMAESSRTTAARMVSCPKCGKYKMSHQFIAQKEATPNDIYSWSDAKKSHFHWKLRQYAAMDMVFTFQWMDIYKNRP